MTEFEVPTGIVHSLNPIQIKLKNLPTGVKVTLEIFSSSSVVYEGIAIPDANNLVSFEISEILQSLVSSNDLLQDPVVYPVPGMLAPVQVRINLEGNLMEDAQVFDFFCLFGGISDNAYEYLKNVGETYFSYRLTNYTKQFLFTTRTSSRMLKIKETELSPLYYIVSEMSMTIVDENGRILIVTPEQSSGTIVALNIPYIRTLFFELYNELSAHLSILFDGNYVFSIVIMPGTTSENRQIIRFRNSLGCYENIEVTGEGEEEPEFEEENIYNVFNPITGNFKENRFRRKFQDKIKVSTGYKTLEEMYFLKDLLSSDDVYLLDKFYGKIKIYVEPESYSHKIHPREPLSGDLVIRYANKENLITPHLLAEDKLILNSGESIWQRSVTNGWGFLYEQSTLNTI